MVGGILSSKAFELGNVEGELGWHSMPTHIVADRIVDQLIKIRETNPNHIREQRGSRGSSRGGSARN